MSDHDAATDPLDKAYVEAEALLGDEAARLAQRTRVLAAVAREPAAASEAAPSRRRSPWRRGGWLAAASLVLFCGFLAARLYRPPQAPPPAAPPPAAPASTTPAAAAAPIKAAVPALRPPALAARPHAEAPQLAEVPQAEARKAEAEPAREALPAPPAPPPPPPPPPPAPLAVPAPPPLIVTAPRAMNEVVVTGSRIMRPARRATAARVSAAPFESLATDPAERLRAAAAAARIGEIETLLARGVPVDAPDVDGTTALMRSIQADQPAAAGLLWRSGANLDLRDRSGASARDMALAQGDPVLDRAVGLTVDGEGSRLGSQ